MIWLRKLKEIRNKKGLSFKKLSEMCGVAATTITDYEKSRIKTLNPTSLIKIAKALDSTPEEISSQIDEEIKMKCLNQVCPLNSKRMCNNVVVLEGRAPCYGRTKVIEKAKPIGWNSPLNRG